jgi:hypothetical protein
MNQTLRPQPQLSEVLPGGLMLGLFALLFWYRYPEFADHLKSLAANSALLVVAAGAFLFAAWIVGTFLVDGR